MSFNHACPDVSVPVIADSAVLLGPAWIGAGTVLAQDAVVRSHQEALSIGIHSAVLENSSVVGTSARPVVIAAHRLRAPLPGDRRPDRQPARDRQRLDPHAPRLRAISAVTRPAYL